MRSVGVPSIVPSSSFSLPISLKQSTARSSPILLMMVLLPLLLALLVPFALLAQHLAQDAATRAVLAERPQAAVQLLLGLGFCGMLFGWPLVHVARTLGRSRTIDIDSGTVSVTERAFGRSQRWSEPLVRFAGVSHTVRSSLSGVRHELTLVHADPSRAVLIAVADRISQDEVERVARTLNVAEIPSREAARLTFLRGLPAPAGPQPRLDLARAVGA